MTSTIGVLLMIFSAFLAACSQVFLKKSAETTYKNKLREILNFKVILSYVILLTTMILNVIAFRFLPYKIGPVLNSLSYIFVFVLSYLFFKEKITIRKVVGIGLIVFGIIIYNL